MMKMMKERNKIICIKIIIVSLDKYINKVLQSNKSEKTSQHLCLKINEKNLIFIIFKKNIKIKLFPKFY